MATRPQVATGHHETILRNESNATRRAEATRPHPIAADPYEPPHAANVTQFFPFPRLKLVRHEETPTNGTSFGPAARIFFSIQRGTDRCILPLFLINFNLTDSTGGPTLTGFCSGSWAYFDEQKLRINNKTIENLNRPDLLTAWEVARDREDLVTVSTVPFQPAHREYLTVGIAGSTTRKSWNTTDTAGLAVSMIHELENPLTRSKKCFPYSWFDLKIDIELRTTSNNRVAFDVGAAAPTFRLDDMRLIYYTVEGYHPEIKREVLENGLFLGLKHMNHQSANFPTTGNFNYTVNESTSSLNKLTIIPLAAAITSGTEEKLWDYVDCTSQALKEIQFNVGGVLYPQQPLDLLTSRARAYEFMMLSNLGPAMSLKKYQGGNNGTAEVGVLEYSFGAHGHDDRFGDGIDTRGGKNDLQITISRDGGTGTAAVDNQIYIHKSGILTVKSGGNLEWTE